MLPSTAQVRADGKRIDTGATRDLAHRAVGVVMQHDHRALLRSEALEGDQQLLVGMYIVKGALGDRSAGEAGLALQVAGASRKAERHTQLRASLIADPRRSAWAKASATASEATSSLPANAKSARHRRSPS
jgi:hypothetical protein